MADYDDTTITAAAMPTAAPSVSPEAMRNRRLAAIMSMGDISGKEAALTRQQGMANALRGRVMQGGGSGVAGGITNALAGIGAGLGYRQANKMGADIGAERGRTLGAIKEAFGIGAPDTGGFSATPAPAPVSSAELMGGSAPQAAPAPSPMAAAQLMGGGGAQTMPPPQNPMPMDYLAAADTSKRRKTLDDAIDEATG